RKCQCERYRSQDIRAFQRPGKEKITAFQNDTHHLKHPFPKALSVLCPSQNQFAPAVNWFFCGVS
ncbi:MAG: hypothetical protein K2Q22_16170, partial [Cytophagales bacterium]|nr:hypothetical protein [Cytophagales bacterium]